MSILELFNLLPTVLGPVVGSLAGLITIDLGLGVAVALRTKTFSWTKVTDFYQTNVLPYGIVAVVVAAGAQFISAEVLPADLVEQVASIGTLVGVAPMFAHLILGSILPNVQALVLGKFKWQIQNPDFDFQNDNIGPMTGSGSGVEETETETVDWPGYPAGTPEMEMPGEAQAKVGGDLDPDQVLDEFDAAVIATEGEFPER